MSAEGTDEKTVGLVGKFEVKRLTESSRGIDHSDCKYFVLDPLHDPRARLALMAYARSASNDGLEQLSTDLINWVNSIRLAESEAELAGDLDAE